MDQLKVSLGWKEQLVLLVLLAVVLAAAASCAPPPRVLRGHVADVKAAAAPARAEHEQLCTAPDSPAAVSPAPAPMSGPPARCEALMDCLTDVQDTAHRCLLAIDQAGQPSYRGAARVCEDRRTAALSTCRALGAAPAKGGSNGPR